MTKQKKGETKSGVRQNGYRDGVSKEDVLKLSKEEISFVKGVREAKERERRNEAAFKLIILSEQGRSQFEDLKFNIEDHLIKMKAQKKAIDDNNIDISIGKTEQKDSQGKVLDIKDLEINNLNRKKILFQYLNLLRGDLSSLFQWVDAKGLDLKTYFQEEEYNEIVKDAKRRVEELNLKLY